MKTLSTRIKKGLLLITILSTALSGFSMNENLRLGLQASPGISWSNPVSKDLQRGVPHFGVNYGLMIEYWFAHNYGLVTGLNGAFDGFNVKGRDAFAAAATPVVVEKYKFNYVELPIGLKFKTNDLKRTRMCAWGQAGFNIDISVSARATYSDPIPTIAGGSQTIEKENMLSTSNSVTATVPRFHANFFDLRLSVGGGIEYKLDERTALVGGFMYNNGFINNMLHGEPKGNPNLMRLFCLRLGVLF